MTKPSEYQASRNLLKNKVILVTGGGSGIGREAAFTFAQHGAEVILLSKHVSQLEEAYDLFETII